MTAQAADSVLYDDRQFSMCAFKGDSLFVPLEYQLKPVGHSTACYRGFQCTYRIDKKQLTLHNLTLSTMHDNYPPLNGVEVTKLEGHRACGKHQYQGVNLLVEFSGSMLLGDGFLREWYVHMGFQKPYTYETVLEFVFKDGKLQSMADYSEEMAEIREKIKARKSEDAPLHLRNTQTSDRIMNWIGWTFSLDYDFDIDE